MTDEFIGKVFEMISSAGTARSKYIEAVSKAKEDQFKEAEKLIKEGSDCFLTAHNIHAELLADESTVAESGGQTPVSLILVHAEDQMMCAETFRLISEELIDVYKKMNGKDR